MKLLKERDRVDYGEPGFTQSLVRDAVRTSEFDVSADAALAFAGDEALGGVALLRGGALATASALAVPTTPRTCSSTGTATLSSERCAT